MNDRTGSPIVLHRTYVVAATAVAEHGPNHVEIDVGTGTGDRIRVHSRGLLPIERLDEIDDAEQAQGVTDHSELDGLTDGDDHTQYALADGSRAFTGDVVVGGNGDADRKITIYSGTADDYLEIATTANMSRLNGVGGRVDIQVSGVNRCEVSGNGIRVVGSSSGGPALSVTQNDVDQPFLAITATSAADNTGSLIDPADLPTPGAVAAWVKVALTDAAASGSITDGTYVLPLYALPTA